MIVLIPGTYDLLHKGHKSLIKYGWLISGKTKIIIAINSYELSKRFNKELKQPDLERRIALEKFLEQENIVADIVFIKKPDDTIKLAKKQNGCFWLTGRDWDLEKTSKRNNVPETFWEENNIYLVYKDRVPNISSTLLRDTNETESN